MTELIGCICFTSDKKHVVFSGAHEQFRDYSLRYPWDSLGGDQLLSKFLWHFKAIRRHAGKHVFMYQLTAEIDELDSWFYRNVTSPFRHENFTVGA
jgi:hypothetical protein